MKHTTTFLSLISILSLLLALPAAAEDFSFDDLEGFEEGEGAVSVLEIDGELIFRTRAYVSAEVRDDMGDLSAEGDILNALPQARLNFSCAVEKADIFVNLNADREELSATPERLLDEAFFRYYGEGFELEAGLMKVVWGKGDQVHVVDFLNADDLSDAVNPDYLDRRLASPMIKLNLYPARSGKLELVYLPTLTTDEIPTEGPWAPQDALSLMAAAENLVDNAGLAPSELAGYLDEDFLYPDTNTLDYSQGGLRYTDTAGALDWGVSYYYGFHKQPSVKVSYASATVVSNIELSYDRLHAFGLEAGGVFGGFNLRGEAAFYLTEDTAGDDSYVHNNSIGYLAGFDRDLPFNNINLNLQYTGDLVLKEGEIKQSDDVDYDPDDRYLRQRLIVKLTDSFAHETIKPELKGIYTFEDRDYLFAAGLIFKPADNFEIKTEAGFYGGVDDYTELAQYDDADYLELGFTCSF
jgi:hypothetical protein